MKFRRRSRDSVVARYLLTVVAIALIAAACGDSGLPEQSFPDPAPQDPTASTPLPAAPDTAPSPASQSAAPAPELAGTSWFVEFLEIETGMTNPWPGTELTLEFFGDGTVSGSAGCNTFSGPFVVSGPYDEFEEGVRDPNDGQAMTLGPFEATEMVCSAPKNVMEQEVEYFTALDQVGRWVIARGDLSLRKADGLFALSFLPME
ncbi:MAG: META domain-containing protein [Acidimicrobiales bacterium]